MWDEAGDSETSVAARSGTEKEVTEVEGTMGKPLGWICPRDGDPVMPLGKRVDTAVASCWRLVVKSWLTTA